LYLILLLEECYILMNESLVFITRDRYAISEHKKWWLWCFI